MRSRIIAALAAAVTPLALAAPADAAPGRGVERFTTTSCLSEEPGEPPFEACFTVRSVVNVTQTRSGNFSVMDRTTETFSVTSEQFTASGIFRSKFTLLLKDGQEQVVHSRGRFTNTFDGVTCRGSFRFMIVKGEVKKEMDDFSCDGPMPEL